MSPARAPETDVEDVTDVTPASTDVADEVAAERAVAEEAVRDKLSPAWEPASDEVFSASDTSLRAIIGRSKRNKAQGLPEYDPLTNMRVWWRANGRGGHSPQLRETAPRDKVLAGESQADYWLPEYGTWVRYGVKKETDAAAVMPENLEEF